MIDYRYENRYLKVVDDRCIQHFGVRNGDYLKYAYTNEIGHQHWGDVEDKKYYWGSSAHAMKYFDLMPLGFTPPIAATVRQTSPLTVDEPMGKSLIILSSFPSEGVCWNPSVDLRYYLAKKYEQIDPSPRSKGVAWGHTSFWGVASSSGKPEYDIKQLEPFFKPPLSILENPVAPEECHLPDKWAIKITGENVVSITNFLIERKNEFNGFTDSWRDLIPIGVYFHYPQLSSNSKAATDIRPSYTEITFEQFKKYVLTHTESEITYTEETTKNYLTFNTEEDGRSNQPSTGITVKVHRHNLSVRGREPARGVGIKCDHIQIKVGSGHIPN